MPVHKTALFDKSVFGMAPRLYNRLPKSLLELESNIKFKRELYNLLVNKCYYKINDYLNDRSL